jgi:magnesium transporter
MQKNFDPAQLRELVASGNTAALREKLEHALVPEIIEVFEELDEHEQGTIFSLLEPALAVETFEFLDNDRQKSILAGLPHDKAASLLNDIAADDRTEFLEELPGPTVKELIRLLSDEERAKTLELLGYPEHSVGRLMTPDYIAIEANWTVQQVLDHVREHGRDTETINVIYVVDDKGKLIDDIRIREFLLVPTSHLVSDLMDSRYITLLVTDDEETAINEFRNNNRVALPVIDGSGILLGIVTIDDVLRLAEDEDTEDIQMIGGTEALEEPYMTIPFFKLMQKRIGWLIVLFLGEMLTATAMSYFEDEIAKAVVLALFVPLIISSGGNSGSQASTLIIRAMALQEVTLRDWWKIMRREFLSGLFLGSALGVIGFLRIAAWTMFTDIYGPHWLLVAIAVGISLIGVVLWGTLSGSMLPLILKRCGADPAVSSAPFVATLVDVTGLVIYFTVAMLIFKGTLL